MMRYIRRFALAILMVCATGLSVRAACLPIVTVTPVVGPNFSSPSFDGFRQNFMNFLANGTPGPDYNLDPTGFMALGPGITDANEIIASSFNSWRGQGDPTVGWDDPAGAFSNELGNRMYFGLSVESPAACSAELTVQGITGVIEWQADASGTPASSLLSPPTTLFDFSTSDYDEFRWGVTGATTYNDTNPAPGSMVVDNIYYLGATTAITAFTQGTSGLADDQANLSKTAARILDEVIAGDLFQVQTTYDITTNLNKTMRGDGTVVIPEPNSLCMLLLGLAFLAGKRRA